MAPEGAKASLSHQEVVANEERILHGSGRYNERLHQRRSTKKEKNYGYGPFSDKTAGRGGWLD